ncbi:MAG TPA: hypothetical protein VNZ64_06280 [Candidatus Acidoferrum sp.]|nr:hypothetical protein [Candidatus Acidoferrum sp.]
MQTCCAALNSTATLVAYDLFKRYQSGISEHKLVVIGKFTTVLGTILAIIASPLFGHYTMIFEGINKLISYVAPPITAVFLVGVFWKRGSGKAAFVTLVLGMALGLVAFALDWNHIYRGDFMLIAFLLLVCCLAIMAVTSLVFPETLKSEARLLVWENWREPLRVEAEVGFGGYRAAAVVVLAMFVGLYLTFR